MRAAKRLVCYDALDARTMMLNKKLTSADTAYNVTPREGSDGRMKLNPGHSVTPCPVIMPCDVRSCDNRMTIWRHRLRRTIDHAQNHHILSWWRHQMETFSALLALCAGNSPVPVNSPHKGQWRGALMFTLICARINDWVNNREAGDLRRHLDHYDVIVMVAIIVEYS